MPLLVTWRTATLAGPLKQRLLAGDRQFGLYGLRSFVILRNHVQVLLEPHAELASILASLRVKSCSHRWVPTAHSPSVIRRIEHRPVLAGLTQRPEQWPWSSAWEDG